MKTRRHRRIFPRGRIEDSGRGRHVPRPGGTQQPFAVPRRKHVGGASSVPQEIP